MHKTQLELLESWLSLSGDLLLSIHLDELEGEPAGLENPPVEVFDLLAGYSTCQDIPRTSLLRKLPLPSLTSLAFRPPGGADSATELREAIWRISYAPSLRNAYFTMFNKVGMELPIHQLTQITMKSCIWQDCLSLLASALNVVHRALLDLRSYFSDNHQAVIALPSNLSSLTVGFLVGFLLVMRVLDSIMIPALSDAGHMECKFGSKAFHQYRDFPLPIFTLNPLSLSLHVTHFWRTCEQALIATPADTESLEKSELNCKWGGKFEPVFYHPNPQDHSTLLSISLQVM